MKLNMDAMRDVMIFLEEHLVIDELEADNDFRVEFEENLIVNHFHNNYLEADVIHVIHLLVLNDYLDAYETKGNNNNGWITVTGITMKGYDLLTSIRNDTVYSKAKEFLVGMGVASVEILQRVAMIVLQSYISSQLPWVVGP